MICPYPFQPFRLEVQALFSEIILVATPACAGTVRSVVWYCPAYIKAVLGPVPQEMSSDLPFILYLKPLCSMGGKAVQRLGTDFQARCGHFQVSFFSFPCSNLFPSSTLLCYHAKRVFRHILPPSRTLLRASRRGWWYIREGIPSPRPSPSRQLLLQPVRQNRRRYDFSVLLF